MTHALNIEPTITGKSVMQRLLAGIKNNAAFSQFCFTQFGKYPAQFLGFDAQNPPKEDKIPWIGVVLSGVQIADGYDAFLYQVAVGGAIFGETSVVQDTISKVYEYDATDLSDEFSRLFYSAALSAMMASPDNLETEILDASGVQINTNLPFISINFDLTISVPLKIEEEQEQST